MEPLGPKGLYIRRCHIKDLISGDFFENPVNESHLHHVEYPG